MQQVSIISLIPFIAFVVLLILQSVLPRRPLAQSGYRRVIHNLLLFVVNTALMRLLIPLTLLGVAAWSAANQVGLFNAVSIPDVIAIVLCVVLLDFAIYWQHVATHKYDVLWRLHKVHHADHDMDVSTAVRFHPIELLLSLAFKAGVVLLLGAPFLSVVIFELLLFVGPAFNHSNLALPSGVDRFLRLFVATPDVHRAHHSTNIDEQNTNYGFFLIWWDKLFGTYTDTPREGHVDMRIGLASSGQSFERVDEMLIAPFR